MAIQTLAKQNKFQLFHLPQRHTALKWVWCPLSTVSVPNYTFFSCLYLQVAIVALLLDAGQPSNIQLITAMQALTVICICGSKYNSHRSIDVSKLDQIIISHDCILEMPSNNGGQII